MEEIFVPDICLFVSQENAELILKRLREGIP